MDCCGGAVTRRSWLSRTPLASAGAFATGCAAQRSGGVDAGAPDPASVTAQNVLKDYVSVDVHSHAGATGVISRGAPTDDLARGMRAGGMATVCLADVPDAPLLGRRPNGSPAALRDAAPSEAETGKVIGGNYLRIFAASAG